MHRSQANSDIYRAIADPTRRAILEKLKLGPASVNSIHDNFSQTRPAISKHLRILREANVVTEERSGRERIYSIRPEELRQVAHWIEGYRAFWQSSLNNLKNYLEEKE